MKNILLIVLAVGLSLLLFFVISGGNNKQTAVVPLQDSTLIVNEDPVLQVADTATVSSGKPATHVPEASKPADIERPRLEKAGEVGSSRQVAAASSALSAKAAQEEITRRENAVEYRKQERILTDMLQALKDIPVPTKEK